MESLPQNPENFHTWVYIIETDSTVACVRTLALQMTYRYAIKLKHNIRAFYKGVVILDP